MLQNHSHESKGTVLNINVTMRDSIEGDHHFNFNTISNVYFCKFHMVPLCEEIKILRGNTSKGIKIHQNNNINNNNNNQKFKSWDLYVIVETQLYTRV